MNSIENQPKNTGIPLNVKKFREKRKWQIALRRYLLKNHPATVYAPYFGLDVATFREWIELQFDKDLNWNNFSNDWQFDHIIPVVYFDFDVEEELKLCWNFTNIRIEKVNLNKNRGNRIDVLSAKAYFEDIYEKTGYHICKKMIEKIERIELSQINCTKKLEDFIKDKLNYIETLSTFDQYEYAQLNEGISLEEILAQKALLKKWGA